MNRARKILTMATYTQESDKGQSLPGHNNNIPNKYSDTPAARSQPDTLPIDSSDTNSIADSQPDLILSILNDEDSEVSSVTNTKDTNRPKIVIEQSDSTSSSSDSDSDSDIDSSSSTSSSSNADFSSDDSVRDPNFIPANERCSDSEGDYIQSKVTKTICISPQPGSSRVEPHSLINDNLPVNLDDQSPNIDTQSISHNQTPSVNIQSPSIGSEPASVNPQLLSRKRKANPESWKRNKTKTLINSGKAHTTISKSKKIISAKKIGPVCSDKCKFKCQTEFPFEQRVVIFNAYWDTGDLNIQRQFIYNHMTKIEPKYRYIRVGSTRQNLNHAYYFMQNDKRIRVCKLFFMNTLGISDKSIRTVVKKKSESITGILNMEDNRGKHGNQFKLDSALKEMAKEHINSIPRIKSHYCRARSKREYIEGSRSIATLHRDYVDKCKTEGKDYLSYKLYYNIFVNNFNISFWKPKKDQCEDCTAFANVEDKTLLQVKYDLHLKEKELARTEKKNDKKNISDNFVVCVYDLQAVMTCPQGEVSSFYYISKLNVLNFTVTELGSNNTNCYVWHEGAGARGANEIGSCVLAYLKNLNERASDYFDVVFYSDNCCGQHKNKFMLATYQYAINKLPKLRSVTHKFLIKGHTQNEGDAAHSLIQRNISNALKSSPIYVPDQYITLIKTAKKKGKPFVVHELTHESFLDLKCLAVGNYSITEDGQKVKWADIKIIKVHRDYENKFFFKTSYETEEITSVVTLTKKRSANPIVPKKLYKQKLKITETKKQGILKLIEKNIIPKYYQSFYENL